MMPTELFDADAETAHSVKRMRVWKRSSKDKLQILF